jgi:glycosyltransferase involved in cell wall biosynthesis
LLEMEIMHSLAETTFHNPDLTQPKRNILVVSRVFLPDPGGIQEYIYNRCFNTSDRIVVLAASCNGDTPFDQQQPFAIYRWPKTTFPSWFKIGGLLKQLVYLFWEIFCGIKLYRQYRFEVIEWAHGYDFPALLLLSYVLPIRYFIYLHGNDVLCPLRNPLLHWLFELTLRRATAIACNSQFTQAHLEKHFQVAQRTFILHPTVRSAKFSSATHIKETEFENSASAVNNVRERYGIPVTAIVILSVGRLIRRKGFERVIQNLPQLRSQGLDVYYLIVGQGAMESELHQLASELGVSEQVCFAGYVPDQQLADFYVACDLFALVTCFDAQAQSIEGFGIVYLEAGYFGKPVLAARAGGVMDAVEHGTTGLLVDPSQPQELASALYQLCSDHQLRQYLGKQGQQRALQSTDFQILYQAIETRVPQ